MMKQKLTDLCSIQYGYAFNSANFTDDDNYLPLIRIRDVKRGFSETFYSGTYSEEYIVHTGDLLIGMDGEFNIARWKSRDALLNQRVCKISAKAGTCEEYLRFALIGALKEIEDKTAFVTVKHLSAKELSKLILDVPDSCEQQQIAFALNEIEQIISHRKQQLSALDDLIKAQFIEMFGDPLLRPMNWEEKKLEEIADIASGITKGRKVQSTDLYEVPYMAVSNVKDGYIDLTTVKTILATQAEIEQYRLLTNDVLMTEGGDPDKLGRGAIIHEPPSDCIHQNHIFRVRLDQSRVTPEFMEQYLQHQKAKRYFLGCAKQTTGIASINMKQLRALPMLIPPIRLQREFAAFVAKIGKSKAAIQKSLDETQRLFDSLMQEYFG